MTEVKIALSIEEAADYTGIGRNNPAETGRMEKASGIEVGRKVYQNGYA